MTPKERRAYWIAEVRQSLKVENKYKARIEKVLREHFSSFKSSYQADPNRAVSLLSMEVWNDKLMKVFAALYNEAFRLGAEMTARTLKDQKFIGMGTNDEWTEYVNEFLRMQGLQLVTSISGTTREIILKIINDAVQEGVSSGMGLEEVSRMILQRLSDDGHTLTRARARLIAATETSRAVNEGHMAGARASRLELQKIWVSAKDNRTRRLGRDQYDHLNLDGQQVDLELPFTSMSEKGLVSAMQPGDVRAPKGFTIRCRCRVAFEAKRDGNGRLIRKPI